MYIGAFPLRWLQMFVTHINPTRVQRVIHSVLACRVVLHIREQGRIQQTTLDHRSFLIGESHQPAKPKQEAIQLDDILVIQ